MFQTSDPKLFFFFLFFPDKLISKIISPIGDFINTKPVCECHGV